jgi:hypothetical protein
MLYDMLDKAGDASRAIGALHRERSVNGPCNKLMSHARLFVARFRFRSSR